jgi:hypothetical protein
MLVKVNGQNYQVEDEEFIKIPHEHFQNLSILKDVNMLERLISLFNELNLKEVEKEFYNICNNIESLMMDIANANIKCIKLFNELNINKKSNILFLLQNIDESSSEEEN